MTIIGVVAAMTIPTLMSKYQEHALESQFKKTYAMVNQAVSLNQGYECHYDMSGGGSIISGCQEFWTNIFNQLKYTKRERVPFPYKTAEQIIAEGGKCEVCFADSYHVDFKHYMADGSTMYTLNYTSQPSNASNWLALIIDVNGDKGPNKWGYDVFWLTSIKTLNGSVKFLDALCLIYEKGGKRVKNILTGIEKVNNNRWDGAYQ